MADYVNELLAAVQRQRDLALSGQARAEAQAVVLEDKVKELETQLADAEPEKQQRRAQKST